MALDDIKKINDEINKLRAELGKRPLKPFDENDLERAKSLLSGIQAEVREMGNDLDYVSKSFKDSVNELSRQNTYLSDARKALNGISNIASKIVDYRKGETSLNEKQLQNLKNQARVRFEELQRIKDIGIFGGKNQEKNREELENALQEQEAFNNALDKTITAQKEVNKQIGLVGTGIEGISKGLSKMGFGDLSQPLTEAIQKTKDARLQMELNKNVINDINKLQEFQNKGYQNLSFSEKNLYSQLKLRYSTDKERQESEKADFESRNIELSTQTSKYKNIGIALKDQLTTANLIDFAIQQMVDALIKADNQTGQLAKAFGTSYSEATSMRNELNTMANLSRDVNITTGALQESLIAVNKEFGTATMLSGELLTDFTNMTKVMGYSNEAAAKLSKITVATGTDLSDNTAQILGTAAAFNVTNDLALNEKEIVEGVAKASAAVTVSLGMQPKAIAAAVIQAKALGLELEQVEGIAKSLLNFESSISNELEAELLTGRSLNLEQARYLALTNDIEGVAKEIANQGITAAEYTGMNSIAAEALAESLGLSREELAQSLINQEALNKAGMTGKTTQEAYAALKEKGLSDDQIAEKLGNKILARQMKSQSVQDRFNASVEKLQELFVSIAEPILQIVSPFMDLATTILPLVNIALTPMLTTIKYIGESISGWLNIFDGGIEKLTGMQKIVGFIGVAILGWKTATMAYAAYQSIAAAITATTAAGAISTASALTLGLGIASVVGGILMGIGAMKSAFQNAGNNAKSIKDGKIDYQKGVVVSGGFGSVQLNEKDTFVGDKNGIKAGTNLFGNTAQSITSPTITVDTAPLANEIQALKAVMVQILNKNTNISLDGRVLNKGLDQVKSKIG
jgi:transcriptional regulator with XRE-family HTH domain